jgi:succinate dehydrogenase/fumarate reductase flavoprotein subunit
MELSKLNVVSCDVLVIGGGGAGLRAAIEAGEMGADVLVVSKYRVGYGNNTIISKATFAASSGWADRRDNPEVHVKDTVIGGRFINDQKLVAAVAEESGAQIAFLEKCGVRFLKRAGDIRALHPPGHSYPRHVRADPEIGRSITLPLRKYAGEKGVRFADRVFITRLFSSKDGRITAAMGITHDGRTLAFQGNCFVLATGGFGQMYLHTNNAPGITGDGQALAFESGLPLRDMEFVQFFPTAAGKTGTRIIVYEDLIVGNNAVLRNSNGDDIIAKHGMDNSFAVTRDRLTRAILQEILEGRGVEGGVIMDLSGASEKLLVEYQSLFRDPDKKEFIVSPTTHFCNGGIIVNENAETDLPGLFAAGEVCAGVHGANRLAGNALAEAFAMGSIAGRKAALKAREIDRPELPEKAITAEKARLESLLSKGSRPLRELRRSIKEVMWYKAGIIRNGRDLEEAIGQIEEFNSLIPELQLKDFRELIKSLELQNVLNLAEMVCRAALLRTESRGAHYRSDCPEENNKDWLKNIVISKKDSGMKLQTVPVSMDIIKQ